MDVRPFAAPSAQPDLSLIAARDAQVDQVKQRHSEDWAVSAGRLVKMLAGHAADAVPMAMLTGG